MQKIIFSILGTLCLGCSLSSCEDNYTICNEPKVVSFKGAFYKKTGGVDVASSVSLLSIRPITTTAYIYNQQPAVAGFSFALDPVLDSAKYIFKIDNSANQDTVSLYYTNQLQLLSEICGSITTHNLTYVKTTKHVLDSMMIIAPKVDNQSNVNLKIYFH